MRFVPPWRRSRRRVSPIRSRFRLHGLERLERRLVLAATPQIVLTANAAEIVGVDDTALIAADGRLFASDGTASGTELIDNIRPGGFPDPQELTEVNGTVFFTATDGVNGFELWKSDGTEAGTVLVKDITTGIASSTLGSFTDVNGTLFFLRQLPSLSLELWKSDGTEAGTMLVKALTDVKFGPAEFTAVGDTLFFTLDTFTSGREVWMSDGTAGGTKIVKDIVVGAGGSAPSELTSFNGSLIFVAEDQANGRELWKSNGTAGGTMLLADIEPAFSVSCGCGLSSNPNSLAATDTAVFFVATAPSPVGRALFTTDGTTGATQVKDLIPPGMIDGGPATREMVNVDGDAFFPNDDGTFGNELWTSDGTTGGTAMVKDITPGGGAGGSTFIRHLTAVGNELFFTATTGIGEELWSSDGTAPGTDVVADICPGACFSNPNLLTNVDGTLFFEASDGSNHVYAVVNQFEVNADNDASDASPGDGVCETVTSNECSLRAAIEEANAFVGTAKEVITFDLAIGMHSITPASPLPAITDQLIIDGTTEPDFAGMPVVEIDGSAAGAGVNGLTITAGRSAVRGLAINRFTGSGVLLATGGENKIQQNMIGTDPTGTTDLGNGVHGVIIFNSANNVIGGLTTGQANVISGNTVHGVYITRAGSTGNDVKSNLIGLGADGASSLGNSGLGVRIDNGASGNNIGGSGNIISANGGGGVVIGGAGATNNTVAGNKIGTDISGLLDRGNGASGVAIDDASANRIGVPGDGNVISGNTLDGIFVNGATATANEIQGNIIGLDMNGAAALPNGLSGVTVNNASNNTIGGTASGAGNVVSGNSKTGIFIVGSSASGNKLEGNFIGTNLAGTSAVANGQFGVVLRDAPNNTVGGTDPGAGNVVSGNMLDGVAILNAAATGNVVVGNLVGTDKTGAVDVGNAKSGVLIWKAPGNRIGGLTAPERNIVSGNELYGVRISTPLASGNVVQGNYIGTDIAGTTALSNSASGVQLANAQGSTIGGGDPGAGNVISGNAGNGVLLAGAGVANNNVQGNYIGVSASGTVALGNASSGVRISGGAHDNTIGGDSSAGEGNVISGNGNDGVLLVNAGTQSNSVAGNLVGTDKNGTGLLGNTRHGIFVIDAETNTIGGATTDEGNVIAGNGQSGVVIFGVTTANTIAANSIFSNGALGIDLGLNGFTANDTTLGNEDIDAGANNLQNFPVMSLAVLSGTDLDVTYSVPSNVAHSAYPLTVEFFLADGSGQEGQTFLGSDTYLAGEALSAVMVTLDVTGKGVAGGNKIVATATDAAGNTSEFSTNITVSVPLLAASDPLLSAEACRAYRGDLPVDAGELEKLQAGLQPIIDAAIIRWQQAGLDANQLSRLDAIDIRFAELDGVMLGLTTRNRIQLDTNAAGYGWFIDPTPLDDSEFSSGSRPSTLDSLPSSDSRLRIDLLTAVMHEIGHALGLDDVIDDGLAEDVMLATLSAGHRRLP